MPLNPAFRFGGASLKGPAAVGSSGAPLTSGGDGTSTFANVLTWPFIAGVTVSEVLAYTGNGQGSTNTKIRRYTSSTTVRGTGITYADSAANGASFTCNNAGLALMVRFDGRAGSVTGFGFSLNSSQGTTQVDGITYTDLIGYADTYTAGFVDCAWGFRYVAANDVIRPHDGFFVPDNSTSQIAMMRVILLHI